jgi:hypothetical protein
LRKTTWKPHHFKHCHHLCHQWPPQQLLHLEPALR